MSDELNYFEGHMRLSDWLRLGNAGSTSAFAAEDQTKTDRLRVLHSLIGLPTVLTVSFRYSDIHSPTDNFMEFHGEAGNKPFALRLRRHGGTGTLARNRGLSVDELIQWAGTIPDLQTDCFYEFEPHVDAERSAIVLVGERGVSVEAIEGSLVQLSKGFHNERSAYIRQGAVEDVVQHAPTTEMRGFLAETFAALTVGDPNASNAMSRQGFKTNRGLLLGYFEVISAQEGTYFVDYNRVLGSIAAAVAPSHETPDVDTRPVLASGRVGSPGRVVGTARVIESLTTTDSHILAGEILVCRFTSPDLAPLMAVSAGVVTEVGGVLSHAAVLCRELGIPSIVGAEGALGRISTGDRIEVDADNGKVRFA